MVVLYIILVVLAYLAGSLPTAYLVGKYFTGQDIRNFGSGNVGSTNAVRMLGRKVGLLVFAIDFLKGLLPTLLGYWAQGPILAMICGGIALLAHIFPVWLKFQGGKGVATAMGVALAIAPVLALVALLAWGLTLLLVDCVAVASCVGVVSFTGMLWAGAQPWPYIMGFVIVTAVILFRHRGNFVALKKN